MSTKILTDRGKSAPTFQQNSINSGDSGQPYPDSVDYTPNTVNPDRVDDAEFCQSENGGGAAELMAAIGYSSGEPIFYRAIATGKAPRKLKNSNPQELQQLSDSGYNLYFVVNGGGDSDAQVTHGKAIFYEHDNLDKALQRTLWQSLGLPEPTIQVDTGGKSIHSYWVFEQPIPINDWKRLQADLLEFADADRTIKNPSRVMRLAGFKHQGTGELATIATNSGKRYSYSDLRAIIPTPQNELPIDKPKKANQQYTPSYGGELSLIDCLARSHRDLIASGAGEGSRNDSGAKLARDLIGTENYLRSISQPFEGDARDLFEQYCDRCSPLIDSRERDLIWKSADRANPSPCLSTDKIDGCIAAKFKTRRAEKILSEPATWDGLTEADKKARFEAAYDDAIAHLSQEQVIEFAAACGIEWKKAAIIDAYRRAHRIIDKTRGESGTESLLQLQGELIWIALKKSKATYDYLRLLRDFGSRIRFNELLQIIEFDGEELPIDGIRVWFELTHGFKSETASEFPDVVLQLARKFSYQPVVEYLKECDREHPDALASGILDQVASIALGKTDEISKAMLRKFLIGAAARPMQPGCKLDTVLILQGPQGYLKSTFFKTLANGWFDDSLGDAIGSKDEQLKLHRCWMAEWAELETVFKRKDVAATKAFLACDTDHIRPPYGRSVVSMKRSGVLCGTTNEDGFLSDSSGSRRFWVVGVSQVIDIEWVISNREKIWAAAYQAVQAGHEWWLSRDEDIHAAEIASGYRTTDPWESIVLGYAANYDHVTTVDVMGDALKMSPDRFDRRSEMRIADILKSNGYRRVKRSVNKRRVWVWESVEPPKSEPEPTAETTEAPTAEQSPATEYALTTDTEAEIIEYEYTIDDCPDF